MFICILPFNKFPVFAPSVTIFENRIVLLSRVPEASKHYILTQGPIDKDDQRQRTLSSSMMLMLGTPGGKLKKEVSIKEHRVCGVARGNNIAVSREIPTYDPRNYTEIFH